jgi:CheY-like chemotaxis protein
VRILLVEDDAAKRQAIRGYLSDRLPSAQVVEVTSFRETLDAITAARPDLVLLDMTIPSVAQSTSDRDLIFGGRDVLRQMRRLGVRTPVIVVTAYERFDRGRESMSAEELHSQLTEVYPEWYRGTVSFSFRYESWREELNELLSSIDGTSEQVSTSR